MITVNESVRSRAERDKCRVLGLGLCLCPGFYFLFFLPNKINN